MINPDIFEPFDRLVEIEILGEKRHVPENNFLLRCFQYLSMETVSYGDFCWNGDCANCRIWLEDADKEKPVLSCSTKVSEGMKIVRMSKEIVISPKSQVPSRTDALDLGHGLFSISEPSGQLRLTKP